MSCSGIMNALNGYERAHASEAKVLVCPVCRSKLEGPDHYCPKCKTTMSWSLEDPEHAIP